MNDLMKGFLACAFSVALIAGCASTTPGGPAPTATQQAITATTTSYNGVDVAINAATAAVRNGTLKGADATRVFQGLTAATANLDTVLVGLRNAQALAAAGAASAAGKPPVPGAAPSAASGALK